MRPAAKRARLSSRHNRRQGMRTLRLAALLLLCGLLGGGAYWAFHSSYFEVAEVVFYGNRHLADNDLARLMDMSAGLNMFSLSSAELAGRLTASPWIGEARIRKEFPRKLLVRVEEAEPSALLRDAAGLSLIDNQGRVLERLSGEPVYFLPVIVDASGKRAGAFEEALRLAEVIKNQGLAARMDKVEIRDFLKGAEAITVAIDGLRARIGKGRYREKLARLLELKDEIKRRGIEVDYLDLRFTDRVVVKPVNAVAKVERLEEAADGR